MVDLKTGSVMANGINFHFLEMGEGPLVLCLHGFPDNAYSFRDMLPDLAQAGFRAVAPFTRGYAPTGFPPDRRYQTVHLALDVLALIDALGAPMAYLVGNDWGARAAQGAAVLEPDKVIKLVTLAASHPAAGELLRFDFLRGTWHVYYFQLPGAEQAFAHNDLAFLEAWWRDASPEWDIPKEVLENRRQTFRTPGVVQAALGYYRHTVDPALQDPAMADLQSIVDTRSISVPTLALHGTRDRPRRLENFQDSDQYFTGGLEKVIIPGTGHFMHQEKPHEVNPKVVEFLKR